MSIATYTYMLHTCMHAMSIIIIIVVKMVHVLVGFICVFLFISFALYKRFSLLDVCLVVDFMPSVFFFYFLFFIYHQYVVGLCSTLAIS